MPPKNKKKFKKEVSTADDDWNSILDEFKPTTVEEIEKKEEKIEKEPVNNVENESNSVPSVTMDAAAQYLAQLGLTNPPNEDTNTKKKETKKKKKPKKKVEKVENVQNEVKETKKPISAAAKILLERQAAIKAEEERLENLRLEQERIEREEEEKRLKEIKLKEEMLKKKKEAKKAKIEEQKKNGTYISKAEKQRRIKAQSQLELLQQSGLYIEGLVNEKKNVKITHKKKIYRDKIQKNDETIIKQDIETKKKETIKSPIKKIKEENENGNETPDDWDADSDIELRLEQRLNNNIGCEIDENEDEDIDLIKIEEKKKEEELRLRGLELLKKEEEEKRRAAENNQQEQDKSKLQKEQDERKRQATERRKKRDEIALSKVSQDNLRSPICCIMGHVDTGKTKLLDNIRRTNVQDAEAGGITQQIGATFFPISALKTKTERLHTVLNLKFNLPGLLVIDTPGHESFTNLRSRGSSLCDIAILVVDIMHGLEPQTLESLRLLRQKRAPFVVALNKIDRCYDWKAFKDLPVRESLSKQKDFVVREFYDRTKEIKLAFAEQGLNAELYWENKDLSRTISFIPTSAITGEGVPDLLAMLTKLTQEKLSKSLAFVDILQCTVLEVKVIEGLGTTVDTILVNGTLHEGATIVVCTLDGPVVTTIRSLLTPHPMKEIRVKGEYVHHSTIKAAMGVKICATGLEKAVAGTQIYVLGPDDDEQELKDAVMQDLTSILDSVKSTKRGVFVQASTLGALEALLEFLRTCDPPIPVSGVNIGPVHKKDVVRASIQLEHQPEYATILAFDVKVNNDAQELAKENGVRIFTADIIYHLFDQFTAYMETIRNQKRLDNEAIAVFPVILKILPDHIYNTKDPIILGVDVEEGILKVGTPLVVPQINNSLIIGKIGSIQKDRKEVDIAKKGASVAVRIDTEGNTMYGRHFDHTNKLISKITRESIDALKENFKKDLAKEDWQLVIKLKKIFDIK